MTTRSGGAVASKTLWSAADHALPPSSRGVALQAMLAFREAGFPTLIRLEDGVVTASGHRLADIFPDMKPRPPAKVA